MDNTDVLIRGYSPTPPKSEAYFGTPAPSLFFGIEFEQDRSSVEERIGYRLTLSNILRAEEICFDPERDEHAYIVVAYRTDAHGHRCDRRLRCRHAHLSQGQNRFPPHAGYWRE